MHAFTSSWNVAPQAPAHMWGAYAKPTPDSAFSDITNQRFAGCTANAGGPRRGRCFGGSRKPIAGQPAKDHHPRRAAPHGGPGHRQGGNALARAAAPVDPNAVETDPHKISQRMKQIFFGKNTIGYQLYLEQVSKEDRIEGNDKHAQTPRADQLCSKRSWDLQVKKWRRTLHLWDPPELAEAGGAGEADDGDFDDTAEDDGSDTEATLPSRAGSSSGGGGGGAARGLAPRSLSTVTTLSSLSASDELRRCNSHSWASDGSDEPDFSDLSDFQF